MEKIFQAVLMLHILSGTTSLLCGTGIMMLQKAGKTHRKLGKLFFAGMAGVFLTSIYMSVAKENWFLLCVGFFSFYLAASGYRVLHFKTAAAWHKPIAPVDHLLGLGGLAAGAGLWLLAGLLFMKGAMFGLVPAVFGTLSGYFGYQTYRNFAKPPADKKFWIRSHATRMTGAYTATVTAFVVVNMQMEPGWVLWLIPSAIITPVGIYQLRLFLGKKVVVARNIAVAAGALVTNKWFDTTSRIPEPLDYSRFYSFTQGLTTELIEALGKNAGVILSVQPAPEQFTGKVYVLTDKKTASACEPTVYALPKRGRAVVIGENTAGAMLSSGAYRLSSGFVLTLPVADYYTFDGVRIEGRGVKPDAAVMAGKALEKAVKLIAGEGK